MKSCRILIVSFALVLLAVPIASGQGKAMLVREAAEHIMSKFGKEIAGESLETVAKKIESLVLKHGDEALLAVQKVGPRTFRLVEAAGEHGHQSLKLLAKHGDQGIWVVAKPNRLEIFLKLGDDAAEAMLKHGEIAEPLLLAVGRPASGALKAVSTQNGRRLAILAKDGELAAIGRTPEVLAVVGKYGDRAMDFVWRNKGALTVATSLAAFLSNPEPFLDGLQAISKSVTENVVKPIVEIPGHTIAHVINQVNWTLILTGALFVLGILLVAKIWLKNRAAYAIAKLSLVKPLNKP